MTLGDYTTPQAYYTSTINEYVGIFETHKANAIYEEIMDNVKGKQTTRHMMDIMERCNKIDNEERAYYREHPAVNRSNKQQPTGKE